MKKTLNLTRESVKAWHDGQVAAVRRVFSLTGDYESTPGLAADLQAAPLPDVFRILNASSETLRAMSAGARLRTLAWVAGFASRRDSREAFQKFLASDSPSATVLRGDFRRLVVDVIAKHVARQSASPANVRAVRRAGDEVRLEHGIQGGVR